MKGQRRRNLFTLVALTVAVATALAVVSAATAGGRKPYREIVPAPADRTFTGRCSFPVLGHSEGSEIQTTFFDKAGNPMRLLGVFPGHTITLTNLDAGKSITVGGAGSFQLRVAPDGSGSAMVTGQGLWTDGNPVTGEPGIWYQNGRVSTTWDAEGNTTSLRNTGTLVDLCGQLES
jgi:hypothetical protein